MRYGQTGTTGAPRRARRPAIRHRALALAALCAGFWPGAALATETARDLARAGYQVAWGGYAGITTCLGDRDVYEIGPYLFVCDGGGAAFPNHFGTVFLVARITRDAGRRDVSTYLCLQADRGDDTCLKGTVFRR